MRRLPWVVLPLSFPPSLFHPYHSPSYILFTYILFLFALPLPSLSLSLLHLFFSLPLASFSLSLFPSLRLPLSRKHKISTTAVCCMLRSNHPLSLPPARSLPPYPKLFPRMSPIPTPPSSLLLTAFASNNPPPPPITTTSSYSHSSSSFRWYRRLFRSRCAVLDVCHSCFRRVHSALSFVDQRRRASKR